MRSFPWTLVMLYLIPLLVLVFAKSSSTEDITCPPGYQRDLVQNLCYKVFSIPVMWTVAFETCTRDHSYLQQFQSGLQGREHFNMSSIITDENIFIVWVGLRRLNNFFQWLGTNPQLFRSGNDKWGLHWKDKTEPHEWDGCGAVSIKTGELHSKNCEKDDVVLPFVCVKPFDEYKPQDENDSQSIELRVVPINVILNETLVGENVFWVNYSQHFHIVLDCQIKLNGKRFYDYTYPDIKFAWSKNGIYRSTPKGSSMYPNLWKNPTPWGDIGRIEDFLGTYKCEANIPYQSRRHESKEISLFLKGTQMFKYNITVRLSKEVTKDCVEPTSSKIFPMWSRMISSISEKILPRKSPQFIGATQIKWMFHYIKPHNVFLKPVHGHSSMVQHVQFSIFVSIDTQSTNDDQLRQQLENLATNREFTVKIETIGKCSPITEEWHTWAMKLGGNRGFSHPICVTNKPTYRILSRLCKVSYYQQDEWESFNHTQCTSKITHLFEDDFCPKGHKMINFDFCAVNGSKNSTWREARDECIKKGSHLPHNAYDIFATDDIPVSSWSVAKLNGRRVYPGPPQDISDKNWTECVVLNRSNSPIWQGARCSDDHSFICLSRIQDALWRVPWCPRGGWLGSEIPVLRNTCYFINSSLILPEKLKEEHCARKGATVANTSNLLIYILVTTTVGERERVLNRKRSIRIDRFLDIPYLVCQKPKAARSPRKAELVLSRTDKYPFVKLICRGINVRPNSRIVWFHNGDPYPELERIDSEEKDYLAAAQVELDEAKQGDYWCEAWDNNAQSTVSSNKITIIVPGINNCVIVLNTSNSSIGYEFEVNKISYYFNKADSNIVRREVTLFADGQMVIWVRGNSHDSQEILISDVRTQFEEHLRVLQSDSGQKIIIPPIIVRSTEWCLQETTTDNGNPLIWPQTKRNQAALPKELCFTNDGNPVSRECLGDFRQGAYWGPVKGSCTGEPNEFTTSLYKLSESEVTSSNAFDASVSLDKLTEAKSVDNYIPIDIAYIAKTMQKISDTGNVTNETLKHVVDTVNRVMDIHSAKIFSSHASSRSSNR